MVGMFRALLVLWPVTEIVLLIVAADQFGVGWTLLALGASALAGMIVIRVLGAISLAELQRALQRREPPAGPLVRGACVLLAGLLLILPGFLSDLVALLLLIPPLRAAAIRAVWRRWPGAGGGGAGGPTVIEGDYREIPPEGAPGSPPDRKDDKNPWIGDNRQR
jgi:UPF0716 protein FxsA